MGLLDFFRRKSLTATPEVVEAVQDRRISLIPHLGGTNQYVKAAFQRGQMASYGWMYANQPAVRSVVDYIARNVAQLPLKLYERVSDTERERREDHAAAQSLAYPNEFATREELIGRLVADFLVYDNAYLLKMRPAAGDQLTYLRLPPGGVTVSGGRFRPDFYRVYRIDGTFLDIAPPDLLHWYGYNPEDPLLGLSKLETLRRELAGDLATQETVTELLRNGLQGGYVKRPLEAPDWGEAGRERFQEGFANQAHSSGRHYPVLEEGMEFVATAITPKDAELLSSRMFTEQEVLRQFIGPFGTKPDGDLAEQRKQLYADVLPPICNTLACRFDVDILRAEYGETDYYFEFDLNEKLRGDLENRFPALTASAGRPWQTINEVRAKENLPPVDGGDELTIPLNVMLEGQGSPALPAPNVMPPQDPNAPPQDGSYREQPKALTNGHKALLPRRAADMARQRRHIDSIQALLERNYKRQANSVTSKAAEGLDLARWDRELATDLHVELAHLVELEGSTYVAKLGGYDFDQREVANYLRAMAEGTAEALNRVTQRDIEDVGAQAAFERARNERALVAGANIGARATVFARREAAKQAPTPERRRQVWIADTERHADLDGVAVPLDSDWGGIEPGSEPNCACSASIE